MSSFIFIIPRAPVSHRNNIREKLWYICTEALQNQKYQNWKALVIGHEIEIPTNDDRFININYEGTKGEKLQKATEYIIKNDTPGDYLIRLDDDDIINPTILEKVSKLNFDIYVDKHQWFWHYESGKISNRVWNWFPNTCIHKKEHALTPWGYFAERETPYFKKFKENALLIENDHSQLHPFYQNKNVIWSNKKHPVYIRSVTSTSITAQNTSIHETYLKKFGIWRQNNLKDFLFLTHYTPNDSSKLPTLSLKNLIVNQYINHNNSINYLKKLNFY